MHDLKTPSNSGQIVNDLNITDVYIQKEKHTFVTASMINL